MTEAGFGADLGAEKFVDIKCRKSGLRPRRSGDRRHGARAQVSRRRRRRRGSNQENLAALEKGIANLERHVRNVRTIYGLPCVVAINHRTHDTDAEIALIRSRDGTADVTVVLARHWAEGGKGAEELAREVVRLVRARREQFPIRVRRRAAVVGQDRRPSRRRSTARATSPRTQGARPDPALQEEGYGHYPVCIAKTQYSFSTDPTLRGAPTGHAVNIREVRLRAGAEFVVMVCGDIMTMPGLPKVPAATRIDVTADGKVVGLF